MCPLPTPSARCTAPSCVMGSQWYLITTGTLMAEVIFFMTLLPLARNKYMERLGLVGDLRRALAAAVPVSVVNYLIILLRDFGVLPPEPWETVNDVLWIVFFTCFFLTL